MLFFLPFDSTILEEEKAQQKERNRMEMRRQVTVSWDSGGSDEAPPKVSQPLAFLCVSLQDSFHMTECGHIEENSEDIV